MTAHGAPARSGRPRPHPLEESSHLGHHSRDPWASRPREPRRPFGLVAVAVVILVVATVIVVTQLKPHPAHGPHGTVVVLAAGGAEWDLSPHKYRDTRFVVTGNGTVHGNFTTSGWPVVAYIMNASDFFRFQNNTTNPKAYYASGLTSTAAISSRITTPDTYYFVGWNPSTTQSTAIQWRTACQWVLEPPPAS